MRRRYPIRLRILAPDSDELEAMTAEHGTMQFRRSIALRNECCAVRKVNPLARALGDYDAWITGLRREQTPTRAETPVVAADPGHGDITKVVPLAAWSRAQVWDYLAARGIEASPALRAGATRRSVALRARGRPQPARTSGPDAGGGKEIPTRSACSIRRSRTVGRRICVAARSVSRWEKRAQLRSHQHRDSVLGVADQSRLLSRVITPLVTPSARPALTSASASALDLGGVCAGDLTEGFTLEQISADLLPGQLGVGREEVEDLATPRP